MIFIKQSSSTRKPDDDLRFRKVDTDLKNIGLVLQGRVRFGTGADGQFGENLDGQFQEFTTNGSADTEDALAHTLGSIPVGRIILWQDKAGHLYQGPTTGTNWTSTNVYFKSDVTSVKFKIFLIK